MDDVEQPPSPTQPQQGCGIILTFATMGKHHPVKWCEPNVTVSLDGRHSFSTISAAVEAAPNHTQYHFCIHIKEGQYVENVFVGDEKTNVFFLGDGIGKTIITANRTCDDQHCKTIHVATLWVKGTGFMAKGLTVENTAAATHFGVALENLSDKSVFYQCRFMGYREVLYANRGIQFYRECQVEGVDLLIFGKAQAVFQKCSIRLAGFLLPPQKSIISAHSSDDHFLTTGFVFHLSDFSSFLQGSNYTPPHSYLGVPLKAYARTIIMQSFMNVPASWSFGNFTPTTVFFGKYANSGPDEIYDIIGSSNVHILDRDKASQFTVRAFLGGNKWLSSNTPCNFELV